MAAALAGAALLLGVAGRLSTLASRAPLPRLACWAAVAGLTSAAGLLAATVAGPRRPARPLALSAPAPASAAIAGLPLLDAELGRLPMDLGDLAAGFGSVLVAPVVGAALPGPSRAPCPPRRRRAGPRPSPILARLARGALVARCVRDHYVDVVTTRGRVLPPMRLGDAIRATAGVEGWQVHRSRWVALDQVVAARRSGDAAVLALRTGGGAPVSRSRLPQARGAGR